MKGPEVSTVGTEPYLGPLPEELAKFALQEATVVTPEPSEKEPSAATITIGGAHALSAAEQAKLVALLANPVTLLIPDMPKLEPMKVPTEGIPQLTAQEIEKHARELAMPPLFIPTSPAVQVPVGEFQRNTIPTPIGTETPKSVAAPTAPKSAQSDSR